MKDLKLVLKLHTLIIFDVILLTVPFAICWYGYYADFIVMPFYNRGNWLIILLFLILYAVFARVYGAFQITLNRISIADMIYSQAVATVLSDGIMFIVIWLLMRHFPDILPGMAALAVQIILAAFWSLLTYKWYFAAFPRKRAFVIYDERRGMEKLINEYGLDEKFDVQATVSVEECFENIHMLDGLDTVFLSGIKSQDRNLILKYCIANDISVYVTPRIGDVIMRGAKHVHLFHLLMLRVGRYNPSPEFLFLKRLFDIVSSSIVLVIISPLMIATSIAIKATDGGPVFYRQRRLTKDGKEFYVLKFRSMIVNAEKDGVARLCTGKKDDRITPIGKIIRKCRIDELPQLFNILAGSMSVVGPRPERPEIAAQYERDLPEFRLRLQTKAGLTGYAQVYGTYDMTPYDKLQMDLMYISRPSLREDLRIIFATIKKI